MTGPLSNQLLAMMPRRDFAEFNKHLTTVELRRGETLALPDQEIRRVYFPHSGIVAFIVELADGQAAQSNMIGRDGVIGAIDALDDKLSLNKIVVQASGTASVIDRDFLLQSIRAGSSIGKLITTHEHFFVGNIQQTAVCNAVHPVVARTCRWLLRMMDLIGPEIPITQEYLSLMIGVRRTSVTLAASNLQREGIISCARGRIHIAESERLKDVSCECYQVVKNIYARLFGRTLSQMKHR